MKRPSRDQDPRIQELVIKLTDCFKKGLLDPTVKVAMFRFVGENGEKYFLSQVPICLDTAYCTAAALIDYRLRLQRQDSGTGFWYNEPDPPDGYEERVRGVLANLAKEQPLPDVPPGEAKQVDPCQKPAKHVGSKNGKKINIDLFCCTGNGVEKNIQRLSVPAEEGTYKIVLTIPL
jgi:hypothetical protein